MTHAQHDANWRPFNEKDMVQVFYTKPLNTTVDVSQRRLRKELNHTMPDYVRYFPNQDYGGICNGHIQQVKLLFVKVLNVYVHLVIDES